jgi:hypothetical protein
VSASPKSITGTPLIDSNMLAPWGLHYKPKGYLEPEHVTLAIPTVHKGGFQFKRNQITLESFYELREAVNDLYDHIRQENE